MRFTVRLHSPKEFECPQASSPLFPFRLLETDNSDPLPLGVDTPNFSGGSVKIMNPRTSNNDYFDTSAFSAELIGRLGTARRKFFSGPELDNYNMSLVKNTQFAQRYTLQIRTELFNVSIHHTQFSAVNGNFNPPTSGKATAANDSRIGQLALKFSL